MMKSSVSLNLDASRRENLERIAGKLLERLEKAMDAPEPETEDAGNVLQGQHDRLFGPKKSLVEVLCQLADLMMAISKKDAVDETSEVNALRGSGLAASDIVLVEAFVEKMRIASHSK